jgi:MraZ protein
VAKYNLIGEYECRLDEKNRIIFPAGLKRQLRPEALERFAIARGFDGSLMMFPFDAWQDFTERYGDFDLFNRESRLLLRSLRSGATESQLDGQSRLLLPKRLLDEVGITKDIILLALIDRIEIWDKTKYLTEIAVRPDNLEELAERQMSKKSQKEAGHGVS